MKIFALVLFTLLTAWNLFLEILDYKAADNPVPLNVIDVYDRKTYKKWQSYHREKVGLSIVSMLVSFLVLFMLFQFDLFAKVSPEKGIYLPILVLVFFDTLVEGVIGVIFSFVNMTIEEKYGFNKSTMETFAQDQVKELVIGFVLNLFLAFALAALHRWLGDWILVLFAALMLCVMLLVSFLYPWLSKIFNHFTPLEDGELKDKLTALLTGHGYKVRGIMVMDASRRTTKSNAYFTGFGKSKTIVLYDTL
ncbi:MAG: M48 family metalloprotease, partial [Clostridia bacterium]|nr:M48 family metalloprotease [Clostridia bacterium]